jgi:hypothetical protein
MLTYNNTKLSPFVNYSNSFAALDVRQPARPARVPTPSLVVENTPFYSGAREE